MRVEDLASYENSKSKVTVFMEKDTDGSYHFLKHIEEKGSDNEQLIRYSLEMFLSEYYLIEKFIKHNLVQDKHFFRSVMKLKSNRNE
jgi:hypothetical protein